MVPRDDCVAFIHIYLHRHREVGGEPEGVRERGRERDRERGVQPVICNDVTDQDNTCPVFSGLGTPPLA